DTTQVILIGHSTGSLLVRKLFIVACGENEDARFEKIYAPFKSPRKWAHRVTRIVLFAGINNGWTINKHLYSTNAMLYRLGVFIGQLFLLFGKKPLAFKTKRGSSFVTQLRIQWLSMLRHATEKKAGNPLVVQLLGTIDDLISPEDNIDFLTGQNFIYLEMPYSDHINVLNFEEKMNGHLRKEVFSKAITSSRDDLLTDNVITTDYPDKQIDKTVKEVVFVIHGIRDTAYWTRKLADRVRKVGAQNEKKFAIETSSYGYFSMLEFLLLRKRIDKMQWLVDQYIENLALYPEARNDFSFFGHSNGTYLFAAALKKYPAIKFKNVVFAGSVVQRKFDWEILKQNGRIKNFLNIAATNDIVVGIFPKAFEKIRAIDLGAGGFDGFAGLSDNRQIKYINGGHGEGITEKYWDEIANFIVHGEERKDSTAFKRFSRPGFIKILGYLAPIPFLLIIAIVFLLGWLLFISLPWALVYKILSEIVYILVVWKILTRF
ncbi:MAG: hypothetical protein JNL23_11850, partial [Chitinophagaceae bacterium]|nr:hypothetical protein [Chitinophagaceae bacterium]